MILLSVTLTPDLVGRWHAVDVLRALLAHEPTAKVWGRADFAEAVIR